MIHVVIGRRNKLRVIKHGKKYKDIGERKCTDCGCKFSYNALDVHDVKVTFPERQQYVICPDCGEVVTICFYK